MEKFGTFITTLRLDRGITLREFSKRTGIDPSNWSKIERSIMPPPKSKSAVESVLAAIGIERGTEEYNMALDMAMFQAIPEDFVAEKEILNELPVFFRTVRGEKPSEEDLQKLIEYLKHE